MVEPRPWIEGYVRAWNSNDPDDISALFTEDAVYYTEPYSAPWHGREEIVRNWLDRQDKPGEATFEWHPVCVTEDVGVIQGVTTYPDKTYSNLWVIRFVADGRCREFTEWWMRHDAR
ncbi:nuclear transport factor 2 family protein [Nonomuraea sp. NPDC049480]|uniref:nuclear transport factor 2 family protein n=1 Tax=Nonomuraea sp. NPDC049480 TaxID=3364353 RepID=UPI0037A0C39C